mgnify:CR=1 FL=1
MTGTAGWTGPLTGNTRRTGTSNTVDRDAGTNRNGYLSVAQARAGDSALQAVLHQTLTPRHPSQIYEALLEGAFLFGCLWYLRLRTRPPRGLLAGVFLLLYALVRIVVEYFREPDTPLTGPFTRGQTLSALLIAGGICFVIYALKNPRYEEARQK